ncbi:putative TIM-barrel fold metal-dependent hydrolase [Pseudomonas baetica]|uniref:TIM-barrel fold metal-dependent hydrolase n=1 Tax=Pseudomonas baetica TaxID=674054 RepID=A0ABX4PSZ2_9PSED|nr:amidohydrolase family protein [Pseudomonas baetica]PKA68150.1 putative TIM-barrel fold metal-dependent hydrolase [Pseudomonas baetica]PTC17977.1 amidohydrolase [Pseudomonas baetica]
MYTMSRREVLAITAVTATAVATTAMGGQPYASANEPHEQEQKHPQSPLCNCGLVDVHAHYLPPQYTQALSDAGLVTLDGGFPIPAWSEAATLAHMEEHGIETLILSVSSPSVGFLDDQSKRVKLARHVNEFAADIVRRNPQKFGAFATLPLPNVDDSLAEIRYALDELGLDGVVVETNSDGLYLGNPRFEPIFAELDKRSAVLFLHPTSPACFEAVGLGRPAPFIEFPMDTARTITDLIFSGTLNRYPNIKVIVSHAGGALPSLAQRIGFVSDLPLLNKRPAGGAQEVRRVLQSLYYDLAGSANDAAIGSLRWMTSTSHIVFGSDFPFTPPLAVTANVNGMRALKGLTADEHEAIARTNAHVLFPRLSQQIPEAG